MIVMGKHVERESLLWVDRPVMDAHAFSAVGKSKLIEHIAHQFFLAYQFHDLCPMTTPMSQCFHLQFHQDNR